MDLEYRPRVGSDRGGVVAGIGAISRSDVYEVRARLRHDFRDPETSADLYRFAPGNDDISAIAGQRAQRQECRCCVIVDSDSTFRA